MKFNTVAEAFNYYRTFDTAALEKRAQEVHGIINTDPDVDIEALNIELKGIKAAKENNEENEKRSANTGAALSFVTGTSTAKKTFDADTVVDTAEYRSAFFKSMLGHTLTEVERDAYNAGIKAAEKRADAFNSSSDALAVLPTETLNEVVKKARTMGGLLAEARAFNVPTKIAIPVGTPSTKANWHTEGAEVESEKASLASVTFDGYEILKVFSISAKVRRMSVAAFEAYLIEELSACVMECIADALVNGNGVNQGRGLDAITWNEANSVAVATSIAYADVVKAVALLKRGYSAGAKWAMNNATLYNTFYGMVDSNKRPIFVADPQTDAVGKILGFEVVVDDNIKDGVAYFGNYSKYLGYNLPEGIAVETSTQSSFKKGLVDYRALAVADCKPIVDEAFIKLYKVEA